MDRNARLEDGRYQRVSRRCDKFLGQGVEDCHVAIRERLVGCVDGFTHAWKAEVLGKRGCAREVCADILYVVDAETCGMLVRYWPELTRRSGLLTMAESLSNNLLLPTRWRNHRSMSRRSLS